MEELEEKLEQIFAQVACQPLPKGNGSRPDERRSFLAKRRDGQEVQVELSADMLLGVCEDKDKILEQLRLQGAEVEAVDLPRPEQASQVLQWSDAITKAFAKATKLRVPLVDFCDMVCKCGERLLAFRRYGLAYQEVFYRYSDRAVQLRLEVERQDFGDYGSRKVEVLSRYYLGASYALYLQTIHRDDAVKRSDTVDTLRDVLKDILHSVEIYSSQPEAVREELYWCLFNSSLLTVRISRWLRLHGFPQLCVPPLWLMVESMQTCLPMLAVHMLPFRGRVMLELAHCAEAAKQLPEALRVCVVAQEHVEKAKKLETFLPPVPAETTQIFEVQLSRFKVLKLKYDFWLKTVDINQLVAQVKEISPSPAVLVSGLLETLKFLHGLPQHFGVEAAQYGFPDGVELEAEAVEVTKFSNAEVQAKQVELLTTLVDLVKPLAQQAEAATKELERFTVARLAWEAEAEMRARTDEPKFNENGEEVELEPRPQKPSPESLEGMGFGPRMHSLEEALPLEAHVWLAEQCLRQEMRGKEAMKDCFAFLERSLALRLRYRHFLRPPLVDVDVLTSPEGEASQVRLPERYKLLTGDLNFYSPQNDPAEMEKLDETGMVAKQHGKHVYIIGQLFDPWEDWTAEYPIPIRRLCNLKLAFVSRVPEPGSGAPTHSIGVHDCGPLESDGEVKIPWLGAPYRAAGAGDSSGFEISEEAERITDSLRRDMELSHRVLEIPVDPHPGSRGKRTPCLFFSVYDEQKVWCMDSQAERREPTETAPADDATLLPAEAAAEAEDLTSEKLLPPWSPLMDVASMACPHLMDLGAMVTKHMHASVPNASFNGQLKADLRQTPGELQGKPFQSYVFLAASVEAPSPPLVARKLRVLRALHSLWKAKVEGDEFFSQETPGGGEGDEEQVVLKRPEVMDRLLELHACLDRVLDGNTGQLFALASSDLLEDVCAYVFLIFAWPKICYMQDMLQEDALKERVLKAYEKNDISEWSHVLRRLLPLLLRTLEKVNTVDALTLSSAGDALARLFLQENDSKSAQKELGYAVLRLERELQNSVGPQARLDPQVASALSFDPPGLRLPSFALFSEPDAVPAVEYEPFSPPASPPGSPTSRAASEKLPRIIEDPDAAIILQPLPRLQQDRLCLLGRLYERWIDCSLLAHLPRPDSPVRRKKRHNHVEEEEVIQVAGENTSTRLALSTQEARVLGRLGENPYLRCFFFISVAKRRPDVASAALGKAVMEADAAVAQERNLWREQEKELLRQQKAIRNKETFGKEYRGSGRKQPAHLPIVVGRMPGRIQLRLPPLSKSVPPLLAIAEDLNPPKQDYAVELHSTRLGCSPPSQHAMTCMVFGKAAGVGTSVSELHRDLHGTGCLHKGHELVEISKLKPNTNYCFATMYFEGLEESKNASAVSGTTSAVGAYYPLPIALLRVKLCTAALGAGDFGAHALKKAWPPLFESFCERSATEEEFDSYGLRGFKLRLDVAERFPPQVLAAFAELVLLRHRVASRPAAMPCTKPAQRAVLAAANECLIAVDCARRSGNCFLSRRAVSLTLAIVAQLLGYRTRPPVLLSLLAKCATALEHFPKPERQLPWHAQARQMVMYLLHQTTVTCVQQRQVALLQKQLAEDLPERYVANPLAESHHVRSLLLDQALELALLGNDHWTFAEKKAAVALQDSADKEELMRLLKELCNRNFPLLAKDASQLALREDPERPVFALSLLRCAALRGAQPELVDCVSTVLSKRRCSQALDELLVKRQEEYKRYGFLLRALPVGRLSFPEKVEDEPKEEEQAAPEDEATLKPEEQEEVVEDIHLEDFPDSELLSQLELSRAAALMRELKSLKRSRHDVSKFKFFDLKQVAAPLLAPDGATLGVYKQVAEEACVDPVDAEVDGELSDWQKQEAADKEVDQKGFKILEELLRILARAAGYAAQRKADQLLQASLVTALNALFLAAPLPEQCVPQGPKSNPMDIDPDRYVGSEEAEPEATEEPEEAKEQTDLWLSLAVIAEFAVNALQRLKTKLAAADPLKAGHDPAAFQQKLLEVSEEEAVVLVANAAAKEVTQAADEELHDVWFEKMPSLDMQSVAQLVAFSVLCLYHMRRWSNIIVLCRSFNDATCSVYATTFLPLMIGAQKEIHNLSKRAVENTQRYLAESKAIFEAEQKKLPRKLLRQLALQGELSEPEKLYNKRAAYYNAFQARQQKTHGAWRSLLKAPEDSYGLIARAVPAAAEQLRKSRQLLADFLCDREAFSLSLHRKQLEGTQKETRERALRLAASALVSSYRKAIELLRKRQMNQLVVQALHELGNLLWLEGDTSGAREAWSDAVDTVFQFPYAIKNWSKCVESSLSPPQDAQRVEILLLAVVLLAKHARLTKPKDMMAHLNATLFSSNILEAILTNSLPNPPRREQYAPSRHRLREIFYGLRETRMILPPNSVYGGVDGCNLLTALNFFQNTLVVMDYQPARSLPICAVYTYVATDICRNLALSVKGRLLTIQALIRCRLFTEAWLALFALAKGHDRPRDLLETEALDRAVVEATEMTNAQPFLQHEEPWSEGNQQAINKLLEFSLLPAATGVEEGATPSGNAAWNLWAFKFLKAEFLITVCSYQRVFPKMNEPQEKERLVLLEKADGLLTEIWKEVTGNEDDREAWSTASRSFRESGGEEPSMASSRWLREEDTELCCEVRLFKAKIQEGKGDLGKAIQEVLYGMEFMRGTASTRSSQECNLSRGDLLRLHPGSKLWMRMRCAMVHLLVSQGRLKAAKAHIQQGLEETRKTQHDICRVELLMAKVRVEVLSGRLLELQGPRHLGALAAAECCLALARRLPMPTPSAVYARMMLVSVLQQNPSLVQLQRQEETPEALEATGGAEEELVDASEWSLLEAAGSIVISPIAKELQKPSDKAKSFHEQQQMMAELVAQSLQEVDQLLKILGLQMAPKNVNSFYDFGADGNGQEAFKAPADPALLPELKASFRCLSQSDARELPNIYLELMPLRLHCQLTLAALRLDLGAIDEACELLRDAELCMTRCVQKVPWQHVQFCMLKLRWRRLKYHIGLAPSAPLDAPNAILYRDPKTFATCICPAPYSPLYRTFLQRAKSPQIVTISEWVPPFERQPEEALELYMKEFLQVTRLALKEGGHDSRQILELLDEGLAEVLRTEAILLSDPERAPLFQRVYPFFACFAAVARTRKALLFEAPQGAGPAPVETEKLPLRVALNLQRQLQRQAAEGALPYSATALQTAQKQIMYRSMMRHTISVRRECDLFSSLFLDSRLLTDQLHVALTQCSEAYVKARVLEEGLVKAIEAPEEVPSKDQVLVRWSQPDLRAKASEAEKPISSCMTLMVFVCPGEEPRPLLARSLVQLSQLEERAEKLATDLEHCRPATMVASGYVEEELREVAGVLRGVAGAIEMGQDEGLDSSIDQLLLHLAEAAEEQSLLKSELVQAAVQALIQLMDPHVGAAQVTHVSLAGFLRAVFSPLDLFPGR